MRKRDTRAEARQGTAISGCPLRAVRIRLVANGVRVIAVFSPTAPDHMLEHFCDVQNGRVGWKKSLSWAGYLEPA